MKSKKAFNISITWLMVTLISAIAGYFFIKMVWTAMKHGFGT